jgi:hypothetical protein
VKHVETAVSQVSVGPNDVVECFTPLLRIREVPGSIIGLETGYSEMLIRDSQVHFSSLIKLRLMDVTLLSALKR